MSGSDEVAEGLDAGAEEICVGGPAAGAGDDGEGGGGSAGGSSGGGGGDLHAETCVFVAMSKV